MDMLNDICIKAARVYRTVNKPLIRSKVDSSYDLYKDGEADEPIASLKIKNLPEVKLFDLILALCAVKIVFSVIGAVISLFRD